MPGVIMMENGIQNGLPTNHDRDTNGSINGSNSFASQTPADKSNGVSEGRRDVGGDDGKEMVNGPLTASGGGTSSSRMNDLPDEIQHITQGYIPLGLLLSRLAQRTHNQLQSKILELAKMPAPAAAVNGSTPHSGAPPDDASVENLTKKASLLNFIQDTHGRWVKALVIAAWSRKASTVSKLIDLYNLIGTESRTYAQALDYMINIKRDLSFARLPNPDLRTALQVLSTGEASWMPDLNFIEPPPLSPEEQMQWIDELNTLLSLRLNLEDHEKIPYQFRDYTIHSGRVTFKVKGEFEVDLTIADEDFEKQFWFLDFRFSFSPAPAELTDELRRRLEERVNGTLEKDGLQGCYNVLHEYVLTHKITEFIRQGFELARGNWVDTLKIERLNRAMAIQYWSNRYPPDGPKSWFILGVNSGRKPGAVVADAKSTSYLALRWFKDNKEVKDATIPFDDANISAETLLKKVIGRHVEYLLTTIYGKLQSKGRFLRREAALSLNIQPEEPIESALKMQLGHDDFVTVRIAPITGLFSMTPQTLPISRGEGRLNSQPKDPSEEGLSTLEGIRFQYTVQEMDRRGRSMGWAAHRSPVKIDEVKLILQTKEPFQPIWFKRRGWPPNWHLMISLSVAGDRWWLIEVSNPPTGPRIMTYTQLPLSSGMPDLTDRFFSNLTIFTAAMISHIIDLKTLHQRHIKHSIVEVSNRYLPPNMKLPAVFMRLSDVLKDRQSTSSRKAVSWATDFVQIMFKGVETRHRLDGHSRVAGKEGTTADSTGAVPAKQDRLTTIADARFRVVDRSKFSLLQGNVEQDVAFNPRLGVFALRLKAEAGNTMLDDLASRVQAIERLVDCVDAIRRSSSDIQCETITLAQVVFTYSDAIGRTAGSTAEANLQRWRASLDLRTDRTKMSLEKGNPHLRVLDGFNRLLNSELGFAKVPQYLAFTLPVLKALDGIEDSWQDMDMDGRSRVEIFSGHLDWFSIRYTLPGYNNGERQLHIQVKLRERRGKHWWHVYRSEPGSVPNPSDDLKEGLEAVWSMKDKDWANFGDSASSEADDRIITLLQALDAKVKELVELPPPPPPAPATAPSTSPSMARKAQPTPKLNQKTMQANKARPQQQHQNNANVVVLDD
ncbi:mediator complex subunit MED14 [Xylariales sp. PMI_506]|nr:mediator complex subunit MED14 [Xylariales sp. PMI_506]